MTTQTELKKVRLSVSNAVHSLSVLVAFEEGLFLEQGLDVELVKTAGSANVTTVTRPEAIFERPLETLYNSGGMDQFRLCEWTALLTDNRTFFSSVCVAIVLLYIIWSPTGVSMPVPQLAPSCANSR